MKLEGRADEFVMYFCVGSLSSQQTTVCNRPARSRTNFVGTAVPSTSSGQALGCPRINPTYSVLALTKFERTHFLYLWAACIW